MPAKIYTACVIPAKGNSVRVPYKNIQKINKQTLLERAAQKAINSKCFSDVFIDTNSDKIWNAVKKMNVKRLNRPENFSDKIHDLVAWELKECQLDKYDIIFHLHCTAPFLEVNTIKSCYNMMFDAFDDDRYSVFTAQKIYPFFWKEENNKFIPMYDIQKMPRSQEIEPIYEETHGLYGFRPVAFYRTGTRFGELPVPKMITELEAYDIDTEKDLKLVQILDKAIRRRNI